MRTAAIILAVLAVLIFALSLALADTQIMVGSGVVLVLAAILADFRNS